MNNYGLILTRWQIKYKRTVRETLKTCPFCKNTTEKWEHFTKCNRVPQNIVDSKNKLSLVLEKKIGPYYRIQDIFRDINL